MSELKHFIAVEFIDMTADVVSSWVGQDNVFIPSCLYTTWLISFTRHVTICIIKELSILYSLSVMFHQQIIYSLIILYLSNLMIVLRFTLYYLRILWEFVVFEISCSCFYICLYRLVVSRLGGNKIPFMSFVHYIFMTTRSGRLVLLYKISPALDIVFPLPLCCILLVVFI